MSFSERIQRALHNSGRLELGYFPGPNGTWGRWVPGWVVEESSQGVIVRHRPAVGLALQQQGEMIRQYRKALRESGLRLILKPVFSEDSSSDLILLVREGVGRATI